MDMTGAEAFLADRFGGEAGDITPLGAGVWSQAFAFRRLDRDYVIRFGAHGWPSLPWAAGRSPRPMGVSRRLPRTYRRTAT
jgi:hypothetical protein